MIEQSMLWEVPVTSSAEFSPERVYRYTLMRRWGEEPGRMCNFLMLNPSTADESKNDPTVERCERRARSWGYDGLYVTNIFAFRATDPKEMLAADDPVGPGNDQAILAVAKASAIVVCAWGSHGRHRGRQAQVLKLLAGVELYALLVSDATDCPWHPLYIPYSIKPTLWRAA